MGGVVLAPRDGCYDVELDTGALLIECFSFVPIAENRPVPAMPAARPRTPARKSESHGS
ncbi:MAG TPA: hypothetical protein VH369_24785 [Bryobacteraceae bacterium]